MKVAVAEMKEIRAQQKEEDKQRKIKEAKEREEKSKRRNRPQSTNFLDNAIDNGVDLLDTYEAGAGLLEQITENDMETGADLLETGADLLQLLQFFSG